MTLQEMADIIVQKTECDEHRAFIAAAAINLALLNEEREAKRSKRVNQRIQSMTRKQ